MEQMIILIFSDILRINFSKKQSEGYEFSIRPDSLPLKKHHILLLGAR